MSLVVLQRINVYFVSILVLLYRIRSFFHLILFSYFIDFVSFRYILFSYFTDFVLFRWISFSYFTDFVGFCFRFASFLSLPVPLIENQYQCSTCRYCISKTGKKNISHKNDVFYVTYVLFVVHECFI